MVFLETARLRLRSLEEKDAEIMYDMISVVYEECLKPFYERFGFSSAALTSCRNSYRGSVGDCIPH